MDEKTGLRPRMWNRRQLLKMGLASVPIFMASCQDTAGSAPQSDLDAGGSLDGSSIDTSAEAVWFPTALVERDAPFSLGLHVGAVRANQGIIATFTADDAPKRLRVWETMSPEDLDARAIVIDEVLTPEDGYMKAVIEGLSPGTHYGAALLEGDDASWTGRSVIATFTTAWAPGDLSPVTFAATACTKYVHMPYEALLRTAEHPYDAFLQLGDMGYYDDVSTREGYRGMWRDTLRDPGYQAVMRRGAFYATLDDHEISNNAVRSEMDPAHYDAGRDAWFEHLAVPRDGDRFWDSYRWGDSVELFVLDCRTERIPETRLTDDAIYISREQLAWLTESLAESPCHFKAVMTSVPFSNLPELWGAGSDWWKGYWSQRQQLVDAIAPLDNVWFIAGDLHVGTVNRVDIEGPMRRNWEIMVGPGGPQFGNPIPGLAELQPEEAEAYLPEEQFLYANASRKATFITFDPVADTVHVRFLDAATGEVAFETTLTQEPA